MAGLHGWHVVTTTGRPSENEGWQRVSRGDTHAVRANTDEAEMDGRVIGGADTGGGDAAAIGAGTVCARGRAYTRVMSSSGSEPSA